MKTEMKLNLTSSNCEITDQTKSRIVAELENELKRFPDHSNVNLNISMFEGNQYSFDLSMRYSRGHVAVSLTATSMEKAIELGLADFKSNLRIHEFQAAIETFHFDKSSEYDYYTEVSNETVTMPQRKLTTLIVEDDPAASAVLQATLKALGCTVDHFDLPGEALKAMETKRYDLLVLDWNLPYMKGGEFLVAADKQLHKSDRPGQPDRQVPFVICTSLPLEEINLPPVTHFSFFNHWHKSLPFSSILGSVDDTTKKVNVRNSISA